jgi:hypothetical protein
MAVRQRHEDAQYRIGNRDPLQHVHTGLQHGQRGFDLVLP